MSSCCELIESILGKYLNNNLYLDDGIRENVPWLNLSIINKDREDK